MVSHLTVTFSKMSEFFSRKSTGIMARILENQFEIQRHFFSHLYLFFLTFITFTTLSRPLVFPLYEPAEVTVFSFRSHSVECNAAVCARQTWRKHIFGILQPQVFFLRPFNLLKTKCNLLYIRNQSVPSSKHIPPRL
jgi:hypothetical protein